MGEGTPSHRLAVVNRSFRELRATRKLAERCVADVAQVGDADFAGVVAVASHVTQEREEGNSLAERGILLGVFAESDEVENFLLLLWRAIDKPFAVMIGRVAVEPEDAAA